MKKIISMCMLAVALLASAPASAQIQFGVQAGLNLSSLNIKSKDAAINSVLDDKNRAGFFIGPMLDIKVPIVGLGLDGALLYNQRSGKVGAEYAGVSEYESFTQHTISIPINVKKSWGLGSLASVFVAVGPQFDFTIGDKAWDSDYLKDYGETWKGSNCSLNLGAGVKLVSHLQVSANYNIALGKTSEVGESSELGIAKDALTSKTNSWQVRLAYLF